MNDLNNMEYLRELDYIEDIFKDNRSAYSYNGYSVPRVSHIIKRANDYDGLLQWYAKNGNYAYKISDRALAIGTYVHAKIDNFIEDLFGIPRKEYLSETFLITSMSDKWIPSAERAYVNFKDWYSCFNTRGYKFTRLYGLEVPIVTPYYGGTADAIVDINGYKYILDFKTSKQITMTYMMQLAAYRLGYNYYIAKDPSEYIRGIGIIRVDKTYNSYDDLFVFDECEDMKKYEACFLSALELHYRVLSGKELFKQHISSYTINNNFKN